MTTETKYVKLQLLVNGVIVFEYVRSAEQLSMDDVEIKLVADSRGEC